LRQAAGAIELAVSLPFPRAADLTFRHDPRGRLVLVAVDGSEHAGVVPVRAFPISDPEGSVAILAPDGRELVWIERLSDVPPPSRRILEEELARRAFLPVITRVLRVSAATEPCEWTVETDRGRTTFLLKSDDDVRRIEEHGAIVVDADSIRYRIPDVRQLDAASRRVLERYL
jgi:hypothetical protein